jgi:hypothetical protein
MEVRDPTQSQEAARRRREPARRRREHLSRRRFIGDV